MYLLITGNSAECHCYSCVFFTVSENMLTVVVAECVNTCVRCSSILLNVTLIALFTNTPSAPPPRPDVRGDDEKCSVSDTLINNVFVLRKDYFIKIYESLKLQKCVFPV